MRRRIIGCALVALLAGLAGPRQAAAKDTNGRVGIGAERTLGGVQGFDIMYWLGRVAINGTVGLGFDFPDVGNSGVRFQSAFGALIKVLGNDSAEVDCGLRVDIAAAHDTDPQVGIELPLRLEYYVSDHFSLHGEIGIGINIIGDRGTSLGYAGELTSAGGTSFVIGATYLTGGVGFSAYF